MWIMKHVKLGRPQFLAHYFLCRSALPSFRNSYLVWRNRDPARFCQLVLPANRSWLRYCSRRFFSRISVIAETLEASDYDCDRTATCRPGLWSSRDRRTSCVFPALRLMTCAKHSFPPCLSNHRYVKSRFGTGRIPGGLVLDKK